MRILDRYWWRYTGFFVSSNVRVNSAALISLIVKRALDSVVAQPRAFCQR